MDRCRHIDRCSFLSRASAPKGRPNGLVVEQDNTMVAVIRCNACDHMWQMQRKASTALAGPDRPEPQLIGEHVGGIRI